MHETKNSSPHYCALVLPAGFSAVVSLGRMVALCRASLITIRTWLQKLRQERQDV